MAGLMLWFTALIFIFNDAYISVLMLGGHAFTSGVTSPYTFNTFCRICIGVGYWAKHNTVSSFASA
jgi:hypothetical protein